MILTTGTFLTFTADNRTNPDCFNKGYEVLENIAMYYGPEKKGKDQGWVLNNSKPSSPLLAIYNCLHCLCK